ncbi:MAG: hypothetical protein Q8N14_01920 [Candidatus Omnitrophota bacterium]|nr:hypothetical protein [Candidatus Omnitrophota bacterium]
MKFEELKNEIKAISFEALREDSEDFFEAVLVKKDLEDLSSSLSKFFGAPAFPSDKPLSPQAQSVVADFGDIMDGQILYFWCQDANAIFAMLWPWGDKEHITLKMGQVIISGS